MKGRKTVSVELPGWTYELEWVRCGKPTCSTCPHGPYWYRYRRVLRRLTKEYVGKDRPGCLGRLAKGEDGGEVRGWWELIHDPAVATPLLACCVLDLDKDSPSSAEIKAAYKAACDKYDPERGGSVSRMRAVDVAFNYLMSGGK